MSDLLVRNSGSLRKTQSGIGSRLSGFVKGGGAGSITFIKAMTVVERHVRDVSSLSGQNMGRG